MFDVRVAASADSPRPKLAAIHRLAARRYFGYGLLAVAFHYDLNRTLFELFLDRDLQHSCAYFTNQRETPEDAQVEQKKRIAAKLSLEPGMRLLDVGSALGGLALHLARAHDIVG